MIMTNQSLVENLNKTQIDNAIPSVTMQKSMLKNDIKKENTVLFQDFDGANQTKNIKGQVTLKLTDVNLNQKKEAKADKFDVLSNSPKGSQHTNTNLRSFTSANRGRSQGTKSRDGIAEIDIEHRAISIIKSFNVYANYKVDTARPQLKQCVIDTFKAIYNSTNTSKEESKIS